MSIHMERKKLDYRICYEEEVVSTNVWAKELAEKGAPEGTVAAADCQKAGRGRRGRTWISPKGTSIYMSLLLRPQICPEQASMLTLVMGLSAAQAIRMTTELDAKIKWPNDIVIQGKKVCGILTEMQVFPHGIEYVIIGIGINMFQKSFPDEIAHTASSLLLEIEREKAEGDQSIDVHGLEKEILREKVLEQFQINYDCFLRKGTMLDLMEAYNRLLVNRNREVRVLDPVEIYTGIAQGIDSQGQLLVRREDGSVCTVYAGEVSVRGIFGYV